MPETSGRDKTGDGAQSDQELWRKVTAKVEPLKPKTPARSIDTPPPTENVPEVPDEAPPPAKPTIAAASRPPQTKPDSTSSVLEVGKASGVDKRTVTRLKRGLLPIEAKIDLHSMTQEQAHRALVGFLAVAQMRGKRCVLVITGKGLRNPCGAVGILKNAVPRWLNEPAQRHRILALTHAPPHLGGDGALLLLLRRVRKDTNTPR